MVCSRSDCPVLPFLPSFSFQAIQQICDKDNLTLNPNLTILNPHSNETDGQSNIPVLLDAPRYLFVSTNVSMKFPTLLESVIIQSYHTYYPTESIWSGDRFQSSLSPVSWFSTLYSRPIKSLITSMFQYIGATSPTLQRVLIHLIQPLFMSSLIYLWIILLSHPEWFSLVGTLFLLGFVRSIYLLFWTESAGPHTSKPQISPSVFPIHSPDLEESSQEHSLHLFESDEDENYLPSSCQLVSSDEVEGWTESHLDDISLEDSLPPISFSQFLHCQSRSISPLSLSDKEGVSCDPSFSSSISTTRTRDDQLDQLSIFGARSGSPSSLSGGVIEIEEDISFDPSFSSSHSTISTRDGRA